MCPDKQILSVYADGELPSPWREKMEAHLERCPACMARLEGYRGLFAPEREENPGEMEEARERVWGKLSALEGRENPAPRRRQPAFKRPAFWRRSVSLPLPAAAAAAAVIIILFIAILRTPGPLPREETDLFASANTIQERTLVPAADMNGVLQYLGGEDGGNFVIVKLPESKQFMSSGEPRIIRAADYSRIQGDGSLP